MGRSNHIDFKYRPDYANFITSKVMCASIVPLAMPKPPQGVYKWIPSSIFQEYHTAAWSQFLGQLPQKTFEVRQHDQNALGKGDIKTLIREYIKVPRIGDKAYG